MVMVTGIGTEIIAPYVFAPGSTDESGALFSKCRAYRYLLWRKWGSRLDGIMVFIMVNPSTADALQDDPTIRRCIGVAKREGCGELRVLNLFAYRSTDPAVLHHVSDPVGPENNAFISGQKNYGTRLVLAWGAGRDQGRVKDVLSLVQGHPHGLWCLGTTRDGSPCHPLYLAANAPLVRFSG